MFGDQWYGVPAQGKQRLGLLGGLFKLGAIQQVRRPRLLDKMGDGGRAVVDRQQQRRQTQLGECNLEETFIDRRRDEHGDDALGWLIDGLRIEVGLQRGVVRCEAIDCALDLRIRQGL